MEEKLSTVQNDLPSEIAAINDDHIIRALSDEDEMPKDHTDRPPEELYNQLITTIKKYHPSDDMNMVREAYELAFKAHEHQLRRIQPGQNTVPFQEG